MLAEPRSFDGRDSAARHRRRLSLREPFADVEQLAALVVFVPAARGRAALGVVLLKALIPSRELAIGTVLVMAPIVRAHDPAAGLGADLKQRCESGISKIASRLRSSGWERITVVCI